MDKVVAFDFDGTLGNSDSLLFKCFIGSLKKFGIDITPEEIVKHYGPCEEGMFKNFLGDDWQAGFDEYLVLYKKYHDECMEPFDPKLRDVLMTLKKIPDVHVVLLTGRSLETTKISIRKFKLNGVFEKYYTGSPKGVNKPISLRKLIKDYKVDPSHVIYVGDSHRDIYSCREVNVKLISVNYYHTCPKEILEKENPGNVVYSPSELKEKLISEIDSIK